MISFPIFVTIVIFMVIPVSHVSIANAISSIPSGIGANNNFRRSDISSDVPTTMTSTYNQGDPFATQSQNLGELSTSTNRIVYTDPVKSGNEPSIVAHPTNPKIVLAFHKSIVDLLDVVLNRTCDIQRILMAVRPGPLQYQLHFLLEILAGPDPVIRWAPADGSDSDKNVRVYASYQVTRDDSSTNDIVVSHSDA